MAQSHDAMVANIVLGYAIEPIYILQHDDDSGSIVTGHFDKIAKYAFEEISYDVDQWRKNKDPRASDLLTYIKDNDDDIDYLWNYENIRNWKKLFIKILGPKNIQYDWDLYRIDFATGDMIPISRKELIGLLRKSL
jgi:hypothetical protein